MRGNIQIEPEGGSTFAYLMPLMEHIIQKEYLTRQSLLIMEALLYSVPYYIKVLFQKCWFIAGYDGFDAYNSLQFLKLGWVNGTYDSCFYFCTKEEGN
ncbi:hypothetical protein [Desulfosporosinus sp. Sb-LF]|uniref:hypothetical protein n=1 Tax=Desulfosporosinus sp. Sb-LF TaxID=2560027 RepID=UPI00107FB760|nr:hypothetical protein [Desulfosporosinus sp. Sb-LF]TGE33876.1 hypothetical protein E4K68_03415 [Desulfosporosinus sp. Sb-LF]